VEDGAEFKLELVPRPARKENEPKRFFLMFLPTVVKAKPRYNSREVSRSMRENFPKSPVSLLTAPRGRGGTD